MWSAHHDNRCVDYVYALYVTQGHRGYESVGRDVGTFLFVVGDEQDEHEWTGLGVIIVFKLKTKLFRDGTHRLVAAWNLRRRCCLCWWVFKLKT